VVDFLKIADRSWPVLGPLMRGHAWLYRRTRGRVGARLPGLPPMLLLDHVGARRARKRTTPLVYMPHRDGYVIVAAKGGHPRNPAWVHNLRANPETDVDVGSRRVSVRAREAKGEERRLLWPKAVEYNRLWGDYQERTERTIPLFVLERSD
jgi:deazaflavin-dependent oxidoreductase (nitroreductase family)